jgi:hypothetical protein
LRVAALVELVAMAAAEVFSEAALGEKIGTCTGGMGEGLVKGEMVRF